MGGIGRRSRSRTVDGRDPIVTCRRRPQARMSEGGGGGTRVFHQVRPVPAAVFGHLDEIAGDRRAAIVGGSLPFEVDPRGSVGRGRQGGGWVGDHRIRGRGGRVRPLAHARRVDRRHPVVPGARRIQSGVCMLRRGGAGVVHEHLPRGAVTIEDLDAVTRDTGTAVVDRRLPRQVDARRAPRRGRQLGRRIGNHGSGAGPGAPRRVTRAHRIDRRHPVVPGAARIQSLVAMARRGGPRVGHQYRPGGTAALVHLDLVARDRDSTGSDRRLPVEFDRRGASRDGRQPARGSRKGGGRGGAGRPGPRAGTRGVERLHLGSARWWRARCPCASRWWRSIPSCRPGWTSRAGRSPMPECGSRSPGPRRLRRARSRKCRLLTSRPPWPQGWSERRAWWSRSWRGRHSTVDLRHPG